LVVRFEADLGSNVAWARAVLAKEPCLGIEACLVAITEQAVVAVGSVDAADALVGVFEADWGRVVAWGRASLARVRDA
jgi:phosphopantothenate synthetase